MTTIEERILALEEGQGIPGTLLMRSFLVEEGVVGWVLGVGGFADVKAHHYGRTIEEALAKAEVARKGG